MIYSAWLTWLFPLICVPLVPLIGLIDGRLRGWLAVAASGMSVVFASYGAWTFQSPTSESITNWFPSLTIPLQVKVDSLSVMVSIFVSFVSFLVVVYSLGYMKKEAGQTRYYSLILLFIGAMLGLVMAGNLIQFYFFWEVVGVCSALLIAFYTDREEARRAGLKAFVVTRVGDASLLLAVIMIATVMGSTTFDSVTNPANLSVLSGGTVFLLGLLIVLGAMGKSAQVPFHVWLPDAMEGPTPVSALIHAATMVNAGVFLLLRMYPLLQLSGMIMTLVLVVGFASALLGGACAFAAEDLKRVLAYSTISQLGLMFAAVGLGSWQASTYHMISQGLFKALAFLAVGSVITVLGTREMSKMGGLARKMKYTYAGFLVAALAMTGLPPLVGFWSKDAILSLAFSNGWLATSAVIAAFALTALYSFRALFRVFHGSPRYEGEAKESPPSMVVPMVVLIVSLLVGWAVLNTQTLLSFASFASPGLDTVALSLTVLALGSLTAYGVTLRYRDRSVALLNSSPALTGLRTFLFNGFMFDALYGAFIGRVVRPLSRAAAAIQTGLVEVNTSLLLLVVVLIFVLYAVGVL
jgi:NADH-quinone oxidoreductase subunit L